MFKGLFAAACGVLAIFEGNAQQPEKILEQWVEQSPIEKIYLHFDRSDYIAGQTIWFKAYLYADFLPDNKSTSLFVELLNDSFHIVSRQVLPVFGGYSRGQFDLPDTIAGGYYTIRAYTVTMLNLDPDFLYKKSIFITSKTKKVSDEIIIEKNIRMEFFPEGGNLITGLSNTVAYKATDQYGLPVSVSGIIKNEKNEKVADFSSYHDGMGYFDIIAGKDDRYFALLNEDNTGQKYYLPQQTTQGVVLRIISSGRTKSFEILQRDEDPVFKASYVIGQMQHHVVFRKTFNEADNEITGMLPTAQLSSGILQLTVFNKNNLPLAERLTFVDNREYIQEGEVFADTLDFSPKSMNHFTLSLKDTVTGSFSVSVSDPAFDSSPVRPGNIFSGLLLTSDIKGWVHDPAYYFSSTADSVQSALDLVMMVNGWRRFKWNELTKQPLAANKYADPGYIVISGKVNLENTNKPFAEKDMLAFIVSPDSRKNMLLLHTNAAGSFRADSLVFFSRARILFTDIKGRRSRYIDVKLEADSLNRQFLLPAPEDAGRSSAEHSTVDQQRKLQDEYDAIMRAEGLMLEGVTLKSRKKTPLEELEEEYVSPLFSGDANATLNPAEEDLTHYKNIFDYLRLRVPGLQILTDPLDPGYIVEYRQQATASSMGEIPMAIFLNEVPSDADAVASIPANQIALVKVFSSFAGAAGNAPGGVLAIYTKKGIDPGALPSSGEVVGYQGYSVIREFYSPDYSIKNKKTKADYRMTLYWNPTVFVNSVNPKIPIVFYNNDRTRQYKIVIEGMTTDGRLLMIEKTFGGKKAF